MPAIAGVEYNAVCRWQYNDIRAWGQAAGRAQPLLMAVLQVMGRNRIAALGFMMLGLAGCSSSAEVPTSSSTHLFAENLKVKGKHKGVKISCEAPIITIARWFCTTP
jgi:hypothetical protein